MKMKRKMLLSIALVFGLILAMPGYSKGIDGIDGKHYLVGGNVYDSEDNAIEIYVDSATTWACGNITAYLMWDVTDLAICNNTTKIYLDDYNKATYDYFYFDPCSQWDSWKEGCEGICVGEAYENITGRNYTFLTSFTLKTTGEHPPIHRGSCAPTEWERIPEPKIESSGDTWINISIEKFKNPQKEKYDNLTTNADNTLGFAVYRDGIYIGATPFSNATHYFFNDTMSIGEMYDAQNYSVKVVAKGNYYVGTPEPRVTIRLPVAGERWTGNETQEIVYVIGGGVGPYTVYLNYSTDDGDTFSLINVASEAFGGTHTYLWVPPLSAGDADRTKINVTVLDSLGRSCSALSGRFVIDCTKPSINIKQPAPNETNVSIYQEIVIEFSESVDKQTMAISSVPSVNLTQRWRDSTKVVELYHFASPFESNTIYNFSIEVKDLSLPGNTNSTTWSFTTASRISLSLFGLVDSTPFSYSGARLTGNVTQEIKYVVGGGVHPYNVTIQFWNGTSWGAPPELNINLRGVLAGTYTGSWKPPALNIDNAKLKLRAEDVQPDWFECEYTFSIDSSPPTIVELYPESGGIIPTTASFYIEFSEDMNTAAVESAFSIDPLVGNISWEWDSLYPYRKAIISHDPLVSNRTYTCTITTNATDISMPGNSLEEVRWNFTALEGLGDLIVSVDFPKLPKKGDTGKITVTVYNTGGKKYNYSGMIVIKFYQSEDGISWTELEGSPQTIPGLLAGAHASRNITVAFERAGDYYFLVEVYSLSPLDLLNGRTTSPENPLGASAFIKVEELPSLIGPYALIALMVLIVIVIGFLVIASYRKGQEKEEKPEEEEESKE